MANKEQLAILKQGVKVWNKWRKENPNIMIDLSKAKLRAVNLRKANLNGAWLWEAELSEANLSEADLVGSMIFNAKLNKINLSKAHLSRANLSGVDLTEAKLCKAELMGSNLWLANLSSADLQEAELSGANLYGARLSGSNFAKVSVGHTNFGKTDLSKVLGLEDVIHAAPSSISTDTFVSSKGKIPKIFLQGCGLRNWEIEDVQLYNPTLTNDEITQIQYRMYDFRAGHALQISPLFISYSQIDSKFVNKLEKLLNAKGIRFWRDIHELKAGRIEKQIDRAISQNPIVLLILSQHSIKSDWVEHEVHAARGLERETGHDVLCPVALDDSWKNSPWEKRIMEQIMKYNILDFSVWENDILFEKAFNKLIDGLDLFYK